MYKQLSLQDTNFLKGIALLLLLVHHLFYLDNGLYDDITIGGRGLVNSIGVWCKICVSIFVFLSGYGLTAQAEHGGIGSLKHFYWHRFTKLYLNYWFIWIVFVPISIFIFHRSFEVVYGNLLVIKFLLDITGVINAFGWYGYNATWWFYSCIICLYLLFPFLYQLMNHDKMFVILISAVAVFLPIPFFSSAKIYIPTFLAGMLYCCKSNENDMGGGNSSLLIFILFVFASIERFLVCSPILFEPIIVMLLVILYKILRIPRIVSVMMDFFGRHSMNIFLFHTFIYHYWFQNFIYATRNPFWILILLVSICIVISVCLEYVKKKFHFYALLSILR